LLKAAATVNLSFSDKTISFKYPFSFLERTEDLVSANLLNLGYNRVLLDSESRGYWLNELAFILHHDVDNVIRLSCVDSLLSALDSVRDVVQITDEQDRMLYANVAAEKLLGFPRDETNVNPWPGGGEHDSGGGGGGEETTVS
jgi:PAS domain-containing protein